MKPFEMPTTFDSRRKYEEKMMELVSIESYIEKLKQIVFFEAKYTFDLRE